MFFASFLQQKIRHLYKQSATKFLLLYETSKPRKQTEKMSKQINRWRVPRIYKKNIEVPGIFNGSHKKTELGRATSNANIFLQE